MASIRSIGEQLRQARQSKGVSLDDISASTRIFKKYLAEIESGTMPAMPATYVRAFIRAFAEQVGLSADDLLRELDAPEEPVPPPGESPQETPPPPVAGPSVPPATPTPPRQTTVLLVVSSVLILALIALLVWTNRDRPRQPVQEVAFSDVVKEREQLQVASDSTTDSAAARLAARPDSLLLEAVASESVWVHIVIDDVEKKEYLFAPMYHLRWKAKSSFAVSVGNGAGISFTLNGEKIGFLGKAKKPVKNVVLAWETLQKLQKGAAPKAGG